MPLTQASITVRRPMIRMKPRAVSSVVIQRTDRFRRLYRSGTRPHSVRSTIKPTAITSGIKVGVENFNCENMCVRQATFEKTSVTFTEQADHAGQTLPTKPAKRPIAGPHQKAPFEMKNLPKKAIGI